MDWIHGKISLESKSELKPASSRTTMPDETPGATPRNIGTQCENIDLESATENNSTRKGLWLKSALKKYFSLGVRTSDPLLTAAKWIAYVTEIGAVVIVALPLLLYFLVVVTNESSIFRTFEGFLIFAIICWTVGLIACAYLHYMWVKPSRHLLLGLQQLSTLEFLPWILTAFIHSVPLAWLFYNYMTTTRWHHGTSTESYSNPKILRTDLWFWFWIFVVMVWALILTPQVIVLAAQQRVRRLSNERTRIRSSGLSTAPLAAAIPATTSPPPDDITINRFQDTCLPVAVDLPESSPSEDLPPSYSMAVLQCPPEYSKI